MGTITLAMMMRSVLCAVAVALCLTVAAGSDLQELGEERSLPPGLGLRPKTGVEAFDLKLERFLQDGGDLIAVLRHVREKNQDLGESASICEAGDSGKQSLGESRSMLETMNAMRKQSKSFLDLKKPWKGYVVKRLAFTVFKPWRSSACKKLRKDFGAYWAKKCVNDYVAPAAAAGGEELGESSKYVGSRRNWYRHRHKPPKNQLSIEYLIYLFQRRLYFSSSQKEEAFMREVWGRCEKDKKWPNGKELQINLKQNPELTANQKRHFGVITQWCMEDRNFRLAPGSIVAIASCGNPAPPSQHFTWNAATGQIQVKGSDMCVNAHKVLAKRTHAIPLVVYKCGEGKFEKWVYSAGQFKSQSKPDLCISMNTKRVGPHQPLQLVECVAGSAFQTWNVPTTD